MSNKKKKMLFDKFQEDKERQEFEDDVRQKLQTEDKIVINKVPKSQQIVDTIFRIVIIAAIVVLVAVGSFWLIGAGVTFLQESGLVNQ